jgi:hypothetical protein
VDRDSVAGQQMREMLAVFLIYAAFSALAMYWLFAFSGLIRLPAQIIEDWLRRRRK